MYSARISAGLEAAHAARGGTYQFERDVFEYSIDFSDKSLCQVNLGTGARRNVRRREIPVAEARPGALPGTWTAQSAMQNCDLKELTETDSELARVRSLLLKTIPNATIQQVHRIQNVSLWKSYCANVETMAHILKRRPAQRQVWHGTGTVDPAKIYKDAQDGFRVAMSGDRNMWGRGIYFADKAKYSDGYAYKKGAVRTLLLVSLLVGDALEMPPDGSLKDPPDKTDGSDMRHDTVQGHTNGSDVFIVYQNGRAYPEYRVQYAISS